MADDAPPPSGDAGSRRRRPGPTIDLTATEIAREPAAGAAAGPDVPEAPVSPEPVASEAPDAVSAAPETQDAPKPADDEPAAEPPQPAAARALPSGLPWQAFGAGAVGGAAVAALVLLLWPALPGRDPAAATLDPRLSALETRLSELSARPAPVTADPKAVDALAARLHKLETAPVPTPTSAPATSAPPDAALARRLAALEGQTRSLSEKLDVVDRRADTSAAALGQLQDVARVSSADHTQVETLAGRVAALEKTDRALADELAKRANAVAEDRSMRLAIAASALRTAVERYEPFTTELAAARPLVGDAAMLVPLEPFAAGGVPSAATLGRELTVLVPAMFKLAGSPSRDGGFIDRLQANAEKLVRVRPVDETPGDSPAAILSRVEIRAAHADIPAALAELARLPERLRAPAKGWISRAEARGRALDATRRLAADSVAALKPVP